MAYIRSINQTTFNVLDYGAVGDGQTDDSKVNVSHFLANM